MRKLLTPAKPDWLGNRQFQIGSILACISYSMDGGEFLHVYMGGETVYGEFDGARKLPINHMMVCVALEVLRNHMVLDDIAEV